MKTCEICGMPVTKACGRESCIRIRALRNQLRKAIADKQPTYPLVQAIAAEQMPGVKVSRDV